MVSGVWSNGSQPIAAHNQKRHKPESPHSTETRIRRGVGRRQVSKSYLANYRQKQRQPLGLVSVTDFINFFISNSIMLH